MLFPRDLPAPPSQCIDRPILTTNKPTTDEEKRYGIAEVVEVDEGLVDRPTRLGLVDGYTSDPTLISILLPRFAPRLIV